MVEDVAMICPPTKKPTMMERLEAKKNEIKERERDTPVLDRTKKMQAEL